MVSLLCVQDRLLSCLGSSAMPPSVSVVLQSVGPAAMLPTWLWKSFLFEGFRHGLPGFAHFCEAWDPDAKPHFADAAEGSGARMTK